MWSNSYFFPLLQELKRERPSDGDEPDAKRVRAESGGGAGGSGRGKAWGLIVRLEVGMGVGKGGDYVSASSLCAHLRTGRASHLPTHSTL